MDTKQLGKPVLFYGDEEEFSDFRFLFYNYMGLIDIRIPGELKKLPAKEFEIVFENLEPGEKQVAVMVFYILASLLRKKALKIVKKVKKENGYEGWRLVHRKYDPSSDGRYLNMLGEITQPEFGEKLDGFDLSLIHI